MEEKRAGVEFQAVILAGGAGNRLHPLTSGGVPKPLMPVGNRPLLAYQLQLLAKSGFESAIVVTTSPMARAVSAFLEEYGEAASGGKGRRLKTEVAVVDADIGTADALRAVADRIHTDFFLLSGDLITDVFIHYLADIHRSKDATMTALLQRPPPRAAAPPAGAGKKAAAAAAAAAAKRKKEDAVYAGDDIGRQYIGLAGGDDEVTKRVVLYRPAVDVEGEGLAVSKLRLARHPHMTVHSTHRDAHLYVFSRWVLDVLVNRPHMSSVQGELVPFLVSLQFADAPAVYADASRAACKQSRALTMSHADGAAPRREELVRCYAHVAPHTSYVMRVNTVARYVRANHDVATDVPADKWDPVVSAPLDPEQADAAAAVGSNSVVGPHLKIGAGSSVKRSVVGSHCKIGKGVKLASCIVQDNVTIEDKCVLHNVVLCRDVVVGARSTVKDTQIGQRYAVPEKSDIKNEALFVARD